MQRIVDPRQNGLFDPYGPILTEATRQRLLEDWPGVFRHVILELMPVDVLGGHFSPRMGRPTRELHSMAGLVLLMEPVGHALSAKALTHGASRDRPGRFSLSLPSASATIAPRQRGCVRHGRVERGTGRSTQYE